MKRQNKIKVAVLMGGKSSEHEISLLSGQNVISGLKPEKYNVLPVVISKDGKKWQITSKNALNKISNILDFRSTDKEIVLDAKTEIQGIGSMSENEVDVIFIAMHGPFGEDGTIQGMLELTGIPYTGSKVLASALGMDKLMFRKVMEACKLSIPKYAVLKRGEAINRVFKLLGKLPYFVKPNDQGSSVGASIVKTKNDFKKAVETAFRYSDTVLVDEFIKGTEVTCAILGNLNPIALPVIEIKPLKGEFFDYESKYTESGSEEIVPAGISDKLTKEIQDLSIKVYKALGCVGFGRVDFILKDNKKPIILEINTIPGLTPMSLLPKAAQAGGISYPDLLDRIIKYALAKN